MDFGENPFSLQPAVVSRSRSKALASSFKYFALIAACFVVTLLVATQSRRWLAYRLTHDFDSLTAVEQQARLLQIADLGTLGISPLVENLGNEDLDVARTSYDLLSELQNQWSLLKPSQRTEHHTTLVRAIESVAVHIPDDRTGWASSLLQQTLMTTVESRNEQSTELHRLANHAMEMLSISDRSGPSILDPEPLDPRAPRRLTTRFDPLPVASIDSVDQWTDWPPTPEPQVSAVAIVDRVPAAEQPVMAEPTLYRSGSSPLQPVTADDPVMLSDIDHVPETRAEPVIQSVTHLVDSPMETYDDKSVIHWLGSPHTALREKAKLELISRGFDGTQISIATQIAAGDVQTRIALVKKLAESSDLDPRPWLVLMLEDDSREVRLRTVSVLATMRDPAINQELRMHLVGEQDPTVAFRIRRSLDIR